MFIRVASALIPSMIVERTMAGRDMFERPLRTDLRETGSLLSNISVVRADVDMHSGPLAEGASRTGIAVIEVTSTGNQPDSGFPNARLAAIIHKGRQNDATYRDKGGRFRAQQQRREPARQGHSSKGQPFLGLSKKQRNELMRRLLAAGLLRVVDGPADS